MSQNLLDYTPKEQAQIASLTKEVRRANPTMSAGEASKRAMERWKSQNIRAQKGGKVSPQAQGDSESRIVKPPTGRG